MTLSELFLTGLIIDDHTLIVIKVPLGTVFELTARGNWFQDHILKYHDRRIAMLHYARKENQLKVWLEREEETE